MKRLLLSLLLLLATIGSQAWALDYETARREAWFLTDKMAYELDLTPEQYDRAYQINLDYLMSIGVPSDCYGYYWTYRDNDLRCILFDWQYTLYSTLDYFYRPIRRLRGVWYYPIADRYRRGYFYYNRPTVYVSYRGGLWRRRSHNSPSPYLGFVPRPGGGLRDHYRGNGTPAFRPEYGRPGYRPERPSRPGGNRYTPDVNNRPGGNGQRPNGGRPSRPPQNSTRPGNGNGNRNDRPSSNNRNQQGGTYSRPGRSNGSYRPSTETGRGNSRSGHGTAPTNSRRTFGTR